MKRGLALLAPLVLAACAGPVLIVPLPIPLAASGPTEVSVEGAAYLADLQPVEGGAQITVTGAAAALAMDQGLLAKTVALQFCADRGKRLDPAALGEFRAGLWVFDGGCV